MGSSTSNGMVFESWRTAIHGTYVAVTLYQLGFCVCLCKENVNKLKYTFVETE